MALKKKMLYFFFLWQTMTTTMMIRISTAIRAAMPMIRVQLVLDSDSASSGSTGLTLEISSLIFWKEVIHVSMFC